MNRLVSVTTFLIFVAACGCARGRSTLSAEPMRSQDLGPVEIQPAEPIRASINEGKIPADRETVRAGYEVETTQEPATNQIPQDPRVKPRTALPAPTNPSEIQKPADPAAPPMTIRTDPNIAPGKPASQTVAIVGDTIITARELQTAIYVQLQIRKYQIKEIPAEQKGDIAKRTLDTLIDRILILQDGRRGVKKIQQWNMFTDFVEKSWKDKELPALQRKEGVEDEISLRRKLDGYGESLDDIKDAWKMETMSRELLMLKVRDKVERPSLHEMEAYYAKHRSEPIYQRDAKVKWREIFVPVSDPKDFPTARQKALALRGKLLSGEDFAKLAKTESAGVTASKGGEWDIAVNGSAIPAINVELAKLPLGQISSPIETPKGIHLIRVEGRTVAGTATFVEVQRKIADKLFEERFGAAIESHLKKLRKSTAVSSPVFDLSETFPAFVQGDAKRDTQTKPASLNK